MKAKKPIKLSFTIAVIIIELIFLVSMITIYYFYQIAENKTESKQNQVDSIEIAENNKEKVEDKKEKTNEIEKKEIIEQTNKKENTSTNIDWEEYPKNDKWLEEIVEEINKENSTFYNLTKKTFYSLRKNKIESYKERFEDLYMLGDSTKIFRWKCNYPRYCYKNVEKKDLSSKYTKKIIYDIAILNEIYCDGDYDWETYVKNQYNALVVEKDYKHYDEVPKEFYYKIPNMLIMNGNNESKEEYKKNARAKKIKVTINNEKTYIFDLKDTNRVQVFELGYKQDSIEKPVHIETEVLEKYKGEKTEDVYISDIQFGIESNIPQGR